MLGVQDRVLAGEEGGGTQVQLAAPRAQQQVVDRVADQGVREQEPSGTGRRNSRCTSGAGS